MTQLAQSNRDSLKRPAPRRTKGHKSGVKRSAIWSWRLGIVAVWLGLWEFMAGTGIIDDLFTSKPSAIASAFVRGVLAGSYWSDLGVTAYETIVGFLISAVLGIGFGILGSQIAVLDVAVRPLLTAANNVPRIALAPLFVLWFGLGSASRIVLVISVVFFVVLFNTLAALSSIDRDILLLARSLGASRFAMFRRYRLPAAVPTIFAGLQLGFTYAALAAVTGEMLTGTDGLGARLNFAIALYQTDEFFSVMLVLVVMALAVSSLLRWAETRLLRWRASEIRGLV